MWKRCGTWPTLEVSRYRTEIEALIGQRQMILRIDRIEPSKNIVRGFQAYEEMLESIRIIAGE